MASGGRRPGAASGLPNAPAALSRPRALARAGGSRCGHQDRQSSLADCSGPGEQCGPSEGQRRGTGLAQEPRRKAHLPRRRVVLGRTRQRRPFSVAPPVTLNGHCLAPALSPHLGHGSPWRCLVGPDAVRLKAAVPGWEGRELTASTPPSEEWGEDSKASPGWRLPSQGGLRTLALLGLVSPPRGLAVTARRRGGGPARTGVTSRRHRGASFPVAHFQPASSPSLRGWTGWGAGGGRWR